MSACPDSSLQLSDRNAPAPTDFCTVGCVCVCVCLSFSEAALSLSSDGTWSLYPGLCRSPACHKLLDTSRRRLPLISFKVSIRRLSAAVRPDARHTRRRRLFQGFSIVDAPGNEAGKQPGNEQNVKTTEVMTPSAKSP